MSHVRIMQICLPYHGNIRFQKKVKVAFNEILLLYYDKSSRIIFNGCGSFVSLKISFLCLFTFSGVSTWFLMEALPGVGNRRHFARRHFPLLPVAACGAVWPAGEFSNKRAEGVLSDKGGKKTAPSGLGTLPAHLPFLHPRSASALMNASVVK